ncbi:MAG: preprotein translocase subunit SecG [Candidatus Nealsonbacteria bacterium CG_4_10_14_0_2_um_filter_38_17]|uniref:Protein-export membrane protein SecG n=2 Tax=Candidatus Nealsoniibacteriota TaxID=1817911 RepID=A0A2M7UZ02_9BACT|nr:MAG: preprotein translocase subunit SecG [Candidatus Nealsonbacteria bacterium CG23_combo_of_CG06-09_8_20_14_all_38_19]PIZ89192.1 MAG: preprotein translocase subunit SecG [Candidatus Nealsonbacteria bacterium CG_4_10_14_0_2_um_filter_38_17]
MEIKNFLPAAQILISILLVLFILLQQRGTDLGSTFGQSGSFYGTLRGVQKKLYWATVALIFLFIALALLNLII